MVRGDEGRPGDLLELRHRGLSHRDHPAWLRRPANRDRPQAGMGWAKHERHKRTHGCAVCEATEPHRLGGLSDPTHNPALSMNLRVLPASCRQTHWSKALPARCRQHLCGAVSPLAGSWKAFSALRPCIGTLNPPLTPPRRGTVRTRRNAYSPLGRGRGWVGSWKAPTTSMPCIGTMNPSGSCHRYGVPPSGGPDRLKPGLQTGGSWKAPTVF